MRGSGYRDSLVWADVVDLARRGSHVVLVSNDKVFADGDGLAPSLAAEVTDLPGHVELVRDFGQWLVGRMPWQVDDLDDAVVRSRDAEFGEWLLQSDFLAEMVPEVSDLGFRRSPYWVSVQSVDWVDTKHLGSRKGPEDVVLVEYDIREDVEFEAELAEGTPLEDDWEILSTSLPGRVTVKGTVRMVMHAGVLYDAEGWGIDELAWRRADSMGPGKSPATISEDQLPLFR